jgi:hypothetical protein
MKYRVLQSLNAGIGFLTAVLFIASPGVFAQCDDPLASPNVAVCGDVPGSSSYSLGRADFLIAEGVRLAESCTDSGDWNICQQAARSLDDADVAIDQMLISCTPRSDCRYGSLTALCNRTERLTAAAQPLADAGIRRSFGNSVSKIQSWFSTPLCDQQVKPADKACAAAIGNWDWFNGPVVSISANGTFKATINNSVQNSGKWKCVLPTAITMFWTGGGWEDRLVISVDGLSMQGHNQHGGAVSASKRNAASNTDTVKPKNPCPSGYNPYGCN